MNRSLPSLASFGLAALLLAVLGLAWLTSWVFSWQGLTAEVLGSPDSPVRYGVLWHRPQFSSLEPAPVAEERPRYLRLKGYFHPPVAGTWQAALISQGPGRISLAGQEWQTPALAIDPAPGWAVTASQGRDPALALDRDPATRYTSGAPQSGGESLALDLGHPRTVLGVILDAQASPHDSPVAFSVELSGDGKLYSPAGGERTMPGLSMADAFFQPLQARWLRITQTGRRPVYYWSVHELYLVEEEMLARRAHGLELAAAPQPITLTLSSDPAHPAGARGYLLGRVFVRPPGGDWQALPLHRLSPTPQAGPPWLAWLALAIEPWLAWAAVGSVGLLVMSLYRDWLWKED